MDWLGASQMYNILNDHFRMDLMYRCKKRSHAVRSGITFNYTFMTFEYFWYSHECTLFEIPFTLDKEMERVVKRKNFEYFSQQLLLCKDNVETVETLSPHPYPYTGGLKVPDDSWEDLML